MQNNIENLNGAMHTLKWRSYERVIFITIYMKKQPVADIMDKSDWGSTSCRLAERLFGLQHVWEGVCEMEMWGLSKSFSLSVHCLVI